jgi:hypothetical protein
MNKKAAVRKTPARTGIFDGMSDYLTMDRIIIGGSMVFTLVIIGIVTLNSYINRPIDIEGVERLPSISGTHQESVNYQHIPPAGGPHAPVWQNCGVYLDPVKDETAVHSLEHGAIWITYRPNLPDSEVARLRNVSWHSDSRLLSPYPNLPSPIVVTAWGYQLQLDSAGDERLAQFLRQYERASTAPEPTGFCNGGEGQPFTQFSG